MPFNLVVGVPTSGVCRAGFAVSLAKLTAFFATTRLLPEIDEYAMDFMFLEGSGIAPNREQIVTEFLAKETNTHLLFIDDDMGFLQNTLQIVANRRQPIVSCNYRMRMPPAEFTALRIDKQGRIQTTKDSTGLEEAYYSGFGFCLMERKVLEATMAPRFLAKWIEPDQRYTTEDHPFFVQAREKGFKCWIDHDASKGLWHNGHLPYVWSEDYSHLAKAFKSESNSEPPK
jgi:hypothetical protein